MKSLARLVNVMLLLVVGVGEMWSATTGTLTMSTSQTSPVEDNGVTFTWSSSNIITGSGSGFKGKEGTADMVITIPSDCKLTGISKTNGNTWGTTNVNVYTGTDNTGTLVVAITEGTNDYTISSNNTGTSYYLVTSASKNAWINSLSITYVSNLPHTVIFSATNGTSASSSLTEGSAGAGVTLPLVTPDAAIVAAGWGFYGWATSSNKPASETTTAPTIVGKAGDTYYPEEDITLYAVYAKGEFVRITSTDDITSGCKYLITAYYNSHNRIMTDSYAYVDIGGGYKDYRMAEAVLDETSTNKYSAAAVDGRWCYTITGSTGAYFIQDVVNATNNYIDTYYTDWYKHAYSSTHSYVISFTSGTCSIKCATGSYPYLVLFAAGDFGTTSSEWAGMRLYKAATDPKYASAPCTNIVTLSEGSKTNVSSIAFSESGVQTCSSTAADRNFTVTVTTNTGYEVTSSSNLTFSKSSGTATASYVSGPTGSGPYTFTYRFAQDDSGAGTFSATATAKTYTITLNGNGATTEGTANVTATYNSATLSSAITNPKKTHYIFQGWYSGSGGTGNLIIDKDGVLQANVSTYTGAGGIWTKDGGTTLYAKWTEHTYTNYKTVCCDETGLAFDGEYNYQTLVREDIKGVRGPNHNADGNPVATVEQGLATLVLEYSTSSTGTCTVEVKKLTGGDKRSTSAAGSDVSNHTTIEVNESTKEVTFQIWTYCSAYPCFNGQGTYRIKLSQAAASTYCQTDAYYFVDVVLRDKFVDAVNGNNSGDPYVRDGEGAQLKTPAEADLTDVDECHDTTRRLRGWISETDLQTMYVTPQETGTLDNAAGYNSSNVVAPYADFTTSGCTWYAVWGEEVTP